MAHACSFLITSSWSLEGTNCRAEIKLLFKAFHFKKAVLDEAFLLCAAQQSVALHLLFTSRLMTFETYYSTTSQSLFSQP